MKFRIAQSAVPRARGAVELSSKAFEGRSVLAGLRQSGAFKVLFPRSQGTLQAILINTAGGVTGGDRFALEAGVAASTHVSLTTQAAERAYRARNPTHRAAPARGNRPFSYDDIACAASRSPTS